MLNIKDNLKVHELVGRLQSVIEYLLIQIENPKESAVNKDILIKHAKEVLTDVNELYK